MKILVTGFEPFGGETVNPALEAARALPVRIGAHTLVWAELPVAYARVLPALEAALGDGADVLLCLGQAGGRSGLTFERVGINLDECTAPDNDGEVRMDAPICPDGPAAYFATLPVLRMAEAAKAAGVPASVSYSAGAYLCNHVLYEALRLSAACPGMRAGFIHLPYLPEQGKTPFLPLDEIVRGLTAAIEVL